MTVHSVDHAVRNGGTLCTRTVCSESELVA
jgi:hypothetical protein